MKKEKTSYSNVVRCHNCDSVMGTHKSFGGYEALDCYPCGYSLNRRGRAAQHIVEVRAWA
jgi:DNA-directed RNA polymerase subunit M/transcription elongation factor TFIIS